MLTGKIKSPLLDTYMMVYLANQGAITWRSGKQPITAQSTTEAEYIAMWDAAKEASWLRNLYRDLGYTQPEPTQIMCDNTSAVAIAKNPLYHKRTKHIDSHYHWVREKVTARRFEVEFCPTNEQTADIFTKPLLRPKHVQHMREMGLSPV